MTKPVDINKNLTAERLRSILSYDPDTGVFRWRELPHISASNIRLGDEVGWVENKGYRRVRIGGHRYLIHRLVWLYVHGYWPPSRIDHIDCDPLNNRINNLRLADDRDNAANKRVNRNNILGVKGVRLHEGGKFQARICSNGRFKSLGLFETAEDAATAYIVEAKNRRGGFAR